MIDSIVNAPVWIQTPVVLLALLLTCSAIAYGLRFLLFSIVPSTAEEREAFARQAVSTPAPHEGQPSSTTPSKKKKEASRPE